MTTARKSAGLPSLKALLRRGNLRVAVAAVLTFGTVLALVAQSLLGEAQSRHLDLVARTVGYSVEAAVTFRDEESAQETLRNIAEHEQLAEVLVMLPTGQVFARYVPTVSSGLDSVMRQIGNWVVNTEVTAPIRLDQRPIGEVRLRSDGTIYVWMLLLGVGGGLLCIAGTLVVAALMQRRMERSIVEPIDRLAALTRSIRSERAYDRRAPPANIAELKELSDDFNAMLDEVQAREAELVAYQMQLQSDNASLARKAWYDDLTGLPNRSLFERRLQEALKKVETRGGHLGVLFLDVDGFKAVNDTAGHAAGDRLLVQMADRLRVAVRETDIVARLGGDEFAVMLYPLRSVDDARRVGAKISNLMAPSFDLEEHGRFHCGMSVGMATYPLDGDTIPALLDTADRAMYRAKHASKRQRRSSA